MKRTESILLTVCRCAVLCGALVMYVYGYVCYQRTVVEAWLAVSLVAVPAILTLPMFCGRWRRLTGMESRGVNAVCHIYVAGALWCFAFMGGNWLLSDPSTAYEETVAVERKIRREHKRYQRITQHSYRVVGVYHTYHLQVAFDDGARKTIPVSLAEYNRTRSNGSRRLSMRAGFFGFPVVVPAPAAKDDSTEAKSNPQGSAGRSFAPRRPAHFIRFQRTFSRHGKAEQVRLCSFGLSKTFARDLRKLRPA